MNLVKNILFFVFLISAIIPMSQNADSINQTDAQGRKQGFWKKVDQTGIVKYEGYFKDDVPYGEFRYFYEDGKIKAISQIFDAGKSSYTKTVHPNGKLMSNGKYTDKAKDSLWKYYDEAGSMLAEEFYLENKKEGEWKTFHKEGGISEILTYKNDVLNGKWIQFCTDGTLKLEANYADGAMEGMAVYYYNTGVIKAKGNFTKGLKNGRWEFFTREAQLEKTEIYSEGRLFSTETLIEIPEEHQE